MKTIAPALQPHHLTWRATCGNCDNVARLFQELKIIARRSDQIRQGSAANRACVLARLLAGDAGEVGYPLREFAHTISGRIVIDGSVLGENEREFEVTMLALQGLDFELCGANTGAGGRMSFVRITAAADSRLMDRLIAVQAPEGRNAEWRITQPKLTHAEAQSDWLDLFLGWVRFFYLPELEIKRNGEAALDSLLEIMFADAVGQAGESTARNVALQWLLDELEIQTEYWMTDETVCT